MITANTQMEFFMTKPGLIIATAAFVFVAACGQSGTADASASEAQENSASADESAANGEAVEAVDLTAAAAGAYGLDKGHGYITFTYSHQGYSHPFLRWRNWDADLDWDPENPENSSVSVVIDAASIDTGVEAFDDHMKSADLFDVAEFPEISFASKGLDRTGPNTGVMTGDLTIKGETRPVSIDVTINKAGYDQRGERHKLGFSGRTKVLRSDFGVDLAVPFVGDEVDIIIEAEFDEKNPA